MRKRKSAIIATTWLRVLTTLNAINQDKTAAAINSQM
jgi:hypothetical protein